MKLLIQIPCFNEEDTLGLTLKDLPRELKGIDSIEVLIIDDGSTDRTLEVARSHNVKNILQLKENGGLAQAFDQGLRECLRLGANIVVNLDGDHQYRGQDIQPLIDPILTGTADFVIGARPIEEIAEFSRVKKILQRVGSRVVRTASGMQVDDATCGFRALNQKAISAIRITDRYTYTLESIFCAARARLRIENVPIGVNPQLRRSRLMRSIPEYVLRSAVTILRLRLFQPNSRHSR